MEIGPSLSLPARSSEAVCGFPPQGCWPGSSLPHTGMPRESWWCRCPQQTPCQRHTESLNKHPQVCYCCNQNASSSTTGNTFKHKQHSHHSDSTYMFTNPDQVQVILFLTSAGCCFNHLSSLKS